MSNLCYGDIAVADCRENIVRFAKVEFFTDILNTLVIFQKLIEKLPEKDKKVRPLAFANLGYSALELARFKEAYEFLETAQGLQEKKSENRFADAFILAGKACVRCAEGFYEQASSLLASAESAWSELSVPSRSALAQHYGPVKKRLVEALSDSR